MRTCTKLLLAAQLLSSAPALAQTWDLLPYTYANTGVQVPKIFASPDNSTLVAGVWYANNREISVSKDGGNTWQQIFPAKTLMSVEFSPNGTIYLVSARKIPNVNNYVVDTLYTSADGLSWTNTGIVLNGGKNETEFTISGNNTLFFSNDSDLNGPLMSKSTDGGLTWTPTEGRPSSTAVSFTGDTILQGTDSPSPGGIKYSYDGGASFSMATGINAEAIPLILPNGDIYAATIGQIWKSTDGGMSFTQVPISVPLGHVREIFYTAGKFYVHVSGGVLGVWETTDFSTLTGITATLADWNQLADVDVSNNTLYAATMNNKLYKYDLGSSTSVHAMPANTTVHVYPNPVSDMIHVSIDGGDKLQTLTLYDAQGREVKRSTTPSMQVAELAAGTYFLLVTGTQTQSFQTINIQ